MKKFFVAILLLVSFLVSNIALAAYPSEQDLEISSTILDSFATNKEFVQIIETSDRFTLMNTKYVSVDRSEKYPKVDVWSLLLAKKPYNYDTKHILTRYRFYCYSTPQRKILTTYFFDKDFVLQQVYTDVGGKEEFTNNYGANLLYKEALKYI